MKNALIILAGGDGKRFSKLNKIPKQFIKINSQNLIQYFLNDLDSKIFEKIHIIGFSKSQLNSLQKSFFFSLLINNVSVLYLKLLFY